MTGEFVCCIIIDSSISELEKMTGISVFPSLGAQVKSRAMKLPEPKTFKERSRKGKGVLVMPKKIIDPFKNES